MSVRSDNILAAQRLDIPEDMEPRWGCNARLETGRYCPNPIAAVHGGPFSERRLCRDHIALYREHDRALRRILDIAPRWDIHGNHAQGCTACPAPRQETT